MNFHCLASTLPHSFRVSVSLLSEILPTNLSNSAKNSALSVSCAPSTDVSGYAPAVGDLNALAPSAQSGPDLVTLSVSFGRLSSIKTSSSSSYSDASRLSSLGSSPFELISEYHRWKTAFHRPFSFRIFQPCGMA